jgi:hypothetical protein
VGVVSFKFHRFRVSRFQGISPDAAAVEFHFAQCSVQGFDGGVYGTALGYQRFSSLRYTDTTHFEGGVERWE